MISWFRAFTKSPIAVGLLGLLLISFAVFGISDVFQGVRLRDAVIQAGPRAVTAAEFKQYFDNYRTQLSQQNQGQPVTVDDAVANGVDRRVLEGLAYQESFAALVGRLGVRPSDKQVVDQIGKQAVFFDPISGRFDRETYRRQLAQNNLTEERFEGQIRDDIAQSQFFSGMAAGITAPLAYTSTLALFNAEGREVTFFGIQPNMVQAPALPNDDQLNAFLKANAANFTKPESRQLTLVGFSARQLAEQVKVDPKAVQDRFEFERDSLSTPERRTIIQIPAKDAQTAAAAAEHLRKGESAQTVAAAFGVEPVVYTESPRTAVADRQVAEAAFAMTEGEVRAPVQGALGLAAVKVEKILPGQTPTLEDVRDKVEQEVRRDAAIEQVYDQVQKYEDARNGGSNLAEAAKAAGVGTLALPAPVAADGSAMNGQRFPLGQQVLETAFSLPEGGESEVVNLSEGEYFAVRVDKVLPSELVKLDEARAQITQFYMFDKLREAMQAKADALAKQIRDGGGVDQAARSTGASPVHVANLQRDPGEQPISTQTVAAIFAAKPGETIVVPDERAGMVVAKVERVVSGDPKELASTVQAQRMGLRANLFNDMGEAVRNAARDRIKPTIDYAAARTALGLQPEPEAEGAPATPAAPAAPAKAAPETKQ